MLKDFLAYFMPLWTKIEMCFQNVFSVINFDIQKMGKIFPVVCDVTIVLVWIGVFLSLIKAVKRPEKSIVYIGLCLITDTDFGLFNSFVLMAAICGAMYYVGPVEAGVILVLALIQFHAVGQSMHPVVKKEGQ